VTYAQRQQDAALNAAITAWEQYFEMPPAERPAAREMLRDVLANAVHKTLLNAPALAHRLADRNCPFCEEPLVYDRSGEGLDVCREHGVVEAYTT